MTKTFLLILLTEMTFLVGCVSPDQLLFESPMVVDHLDGNYQRLAFCTYEQLARREGQLLMTDFHEQRTVRIALTKGGETHWELSFIHEDEGRQTRLEVTSANRSFPSEHALALVRACAA
jgi:hypothetical protein